LITSAVVNQAPKWYNTEQVSSGDDNSPELFEVVGTTRKAGEAPVPAPADGDDAADLGFSASSVASTAAAAVPGKRKRGRPRKVRPEEAQEAAASAPVKAPAQDEKPESEETAIEASPAAETTLEVVHEGDGNPDSDSEAAA
jgi:hypothetical protein